MINDEGKRELGMMSQQAIRAISLAVWRESARLLERAEGHYERDELTPERAQAILIGLIEQRHTYARLVAQANEGVRAARRIEKRMEREAEAKRESEQAYLHGRNRFTRSKVPPIPTEARDSG